MAFEYVKAAAVVCVCRAPDVESHAVLRALADFADDETGLAFPYQDSLAERARVSGTTLRVRLRQFESQKAIVTTRTGRARANHYTLNLDVLKTHLDGSPTKPGRPCPCSHDQRPASHDQRPASHDQRPASHVTSPGAGPIYEELPKELLKELSLPRTHEKRSQHCEPTPAVQKREEREPETRTDRTEQELEVRAAETPSAAVERTPEQRALAWKTLLAEAGQRLASAPALSKSLWQEWATKWCESGGEIEHCRIVGRWIAAGGLDWLKKPKAHYLVTHWGEALGQALEHDAKRRPIGPTRAGAGAPEGAKVLRVAAQTAEPPPAAAVEALTRLGFAFESAPVAAPPAARRLPNTARADDTGRQLARHELLVAIQASRSRPAEHQKLQSQLVEQFGGLAYRYAERWVCDEIPLEDLRQEAVLWFLDAADRFDPRRKGFSTFALWRMRHGLSEFVKRKCPDVHVPGNVLKDQTKIRKVAEQLLVKLGRPAKRGELLEHIPKLTPQRLEAALALWDGVEVTNYDDKAEWLTGIGDET